MSEREDPMEEALPDCEARTPTELTVMYALEVMSNAKALSNQLAALMSLDGAYRSHIGELKDGERKKGLPIFEMMASLDGVEAVQVVLDLKHVHPAHIQHVLVPLINAQAVGLRQTIADMLHAGAKAAEALEMMLAPPEPAPA